MDTVIDLIQDLISIINHAHHHHISCREVVVVVAAVKDNAIFLLILVMDLMALRRDITPVPQIKVKRVMVNINNHLIHPICHSLLLFINSHRGPVQVLVQGQGLRGIWFHHLQKILPSIIKVKVKAQAQRRRRDKAKRETSRKKVVRQRKRRVRWMEWQCRCPQDGKSGNGMYRMKCMLG
jgi:hypothetical protein